MEIFFPNGKDRERQTVGQAQLRKQTAGSPYLLSNIIKVIQIFINI